MGDAWGPSAEMTVFPHSSAARELFADGHVVVPGVFAEVEVGGLRECVEESRASVPRSREILYTHRAPSVDGRGMDALMDQWLNPHRRVGHGSTLRWAAALRPLVEGLLGGPAVLFQDLLLDKRSQHGPFHWHQDFPFWPVDRPCGLVVWLALDSVSEVSGGLRLGRGAASECGPAIDLHTGGPQPGFEERTVVPPTSWIAPTLRAGDAIVFLPLTWHGSGENRSGALRRVWASTWLASEVRWRHAAAPRHPMVARVVDGELVGSGGWAPLVEASTCGD